MYISVKRSDRSGESRIRPEAAALGLLLLSLSLGGCRLPAAVVFQTETLEKCQKAIESEAPKFEKKVFGALKKCKDLYRAAVADGDPLTEPASKCDLALTKVLLYPDAENKSALAKAKIKLDSFSDPEKVKCSDTDLVALGHLPTENFGDLWARLLLVRRIGAAVAGQISAIRDTPDIMSALAAAGCTRCGALAAPPCFEARCGIDPTSTTEFGGINFVPPGGALNLEVCRNAALLGSDFALFAGPAKTMTPFDLTSGNDGYMCVTAIGGSGYVASSGSALEKIDTATCQDHINGDGNECLAFLSPEVAVCASPMADPHHVSVTNSGACAAFAESASAAGDAFLLASFRLSKTCDGGANCGGVDQRGADGLPCTADDTGLVGSTLPIGLTTASATADILDGDNTNGNSISLASTPVGAVFNPNSVSGGDLAGGALVGAVPGLHTVAASPPEDSPFEISVVCN
jgi:hypothetical protein